MISWSSCYTYISYYEFQSREDKNHLPGKRFQEAVLHIERLSLPIPLMTTSASKGTSLNSTTTFLALHVPPSQTPIDPISSLPSRWRIFPAANSNSRWAEGGQKGMVVPLHDAPFSSQQASSKACQRTKCRYKIYLLVCGARMNRRARVKGFQGCADCASGGCRVEMFEMWPRTRMPWN